MESNVEAAGASAMEIDSDNTNSPSKRTKATKRKFTAQNKGPKKKRRDVFMPPIVQTQQVEVESSSFLNCKIVLDKISLYSCGFFKIFNQLIFCFFKFCRYMTFSKSADC